MLGSIIALIWRIWRLFHPVPSPAPPPPPEPDDAFPEALKFILDPSRDGHASDSAPGEKFRTSWGITQMTWDEAVQLRIVDSKPLEQMTQQDMVTVYRKLYWNRLGCPKMNPGVALMVFNDGCLAGTGEAARLLQRVVGAEPDGVVGAETLQHVRDKPPKDVIGSLKLADEEFLRSLASAPKFINGWTRREDACAELALTLA